jgi:hypothetical protein
VGIVICEKGEKVNGKLHQSSLGQGFDRGKSISVCDIRNTASHGKIHGNSKRSGESAVEKKRGKVINILYICIAFCRKHYPAKGI